MAEVVHLELFFIQVEKGHGHLPACAGALYDQGIHLIEKGFQGDAQLPLLGYLHDLALGGIAEIGDLQGITAWGQPLQGELSARVRRTALGGFRQPDIGPF